MTKVARDLRRTAHKPADPVWAGFRISEHASAMAQDLRLVVNSDATAQQPDASFHTVR